MYLTEDAQFLMRGERLFVFTNSKIGQVLDEVIAFIDELRTA